MPVFFPFQQLPVGGNLDIEGQFDVHQFLVLPNLQCHVLLGSLQSLLQLSDAELGVLHGQFATLLCLGNLSLQVVSLKAEQGEKRVRVESNYSGKSRKRLGLLKHCGCCVSPVL